MELPFRFILNFSECRALTVHSCEEWEVSSYYFQTRATYEAADELGLALKNSWELALLS